MTAVAAWPDASHLTADRRARELDELAGGVVLDVLVIGGGITGAGVALDAASRGLSVALVERCDLAAGTSRRSSKLVHGGLRYLASGQVAVAAESTRERGILATAVAPHLIRPLGFLTPLGPGGMSRVMGAATSSALHGADLLRRQAGTPASILPAPHRVEADVARMLVPGIRTAGLRGGLVHWDGQLEDDARLVVAVARTAAAHGARILTRVSATQTGPGGATVLDHLTGSRLDLRARHVVNATGVWASQLDPAVALRPSRGTHVVLPSALLGDPRTALCAPVPDHFGRLLFSLPQPDGLTLLGLTDEPADEVVDVPVPTQAEIDFLLETFSAALDRPLGRSDVLGAYAGLRPLVAGAAPDPGHGRESDEPATADLSRRHAVLRHGDAITVTGGKLTTYRRMAQDVVDLISDVPCSTASLPLVGARDAQRPDPSGLPGLPARLLRRFAAEAEQVAALAGGDPALLAPLVPGQPQLGVEVLWALRAEGALSAEDVLDGRLRLDLVPAWRERARERVEALVAAHAPAPVPA